jgi:hypothetical protein
MDAQETLDNRLLAEILRRLPTQRDPRAITAMLADTIDMSWQSKDDSGDKNTRLRIRRSLNAELQISAAILSAK